ncbi:MAG: Hsp20/alpha crystallin family protein [Bacteroidia bacterium]
MTQIRFANNSDLVNLQKPFSTLFNSLLNDATVYPAEQANTFRPHAEISETEESYHLKLALPGYKKENISINLDGNKLTISGEVKAETEAKEDEKKIKYYLREIRNGNFSRAFSLPKNADTEKIEANFNDGILSLYIPKSETKALGKTIEIR